MLALASKIALASLTAGLANTSGLLVAARLVQGTGAALMAPAALSTLTTTGRVPVNAVRQGTWTRAPR